jgi:lysocardiolipin and lysophospholipid acyltransferase
MTIPSCSTHTGWGMSACSFIFIKRGSQNRARDLGRVRALCRYLLRLRVANSLILFPEGTDLSASNQRKDAEYAAKQGLQPYTYVLHPRGGAFAASLAVLRRPGGVDALYDMTMAFEDYAPGERPNELALLRGA